MKMNTIGYAVGVALMALLRGGVRVVLRAMPVAGLGGITTRINMKRRLLRTKRREVAAIKAPTQPLAADVHVAAKNLTTATSEFEAADRIVSIRLIPPVGVINLRVHDKLELVKRDLVVSEPCLRALMKGRRHTLPDVPYDRMAGLDPIKDETIEAFEKLINEVGRLAVRGGRPRKDDVVRYKALVQPTGAPVAVVPSEGQAKPGTAMRDTPKGDPPMASVVAPKVLPGYTYVGKLVKAGTETRRPNGRPAYEIFEVTLLLDNGAELALRGAELERELSSNGCRIGERVRITPMGKVPVTLASGEEGAKNLYRVQRMDERGTEQGT
jgi:hypothetical protein